MFWRISQDQIINQVLQKKQPHNQAFIPTDLYSFFPQWKPKHPDTMSSWWCWELCWNMQSIKEFFISNQVHPQSKVSPPPVLLDSWDASGWGSRVSWSHPPFCSIPRVHSQICWLSRIFPGRPLAKGTYRVSGSLSHIHPISLVLYSSQQALVYIILFHPFLKAT